MGISNDYIISEQKKTVKMFFGNLACKKIAFLGSSEAHVKKYDPDDGGFIASYGATVESYTSELFQPDRIDYFDILENNWDINGSWHEVSGYDLVIAFRVDMFATSKEHFLEEMKKLVRNNKHVLFDFSIYSGNVKYRNKSYSTIGAKLPRIAPLGDRSLSFDFREELSFWQKIKAFFLLHYGLTYFSGKVINSFNRKDFERYGIKILKTKYSYRTIKKDLACYLYLQSN